jgi:L-lactate dehydrogenase complex protein LldG
MIDRLVEALEVNRCTVRRCDQAQVVDTVATALAERGAGLVAFADGPAMQRHGVLDGIAERFEVLRPQDSRWRERLPQAAVGLTGADVAAAAEGALALAAAPGAPRAVSVVPPAHVCVLDAGSVEADFATAVARLAREPLPSALTWITGPSRTGDLEMQLTHGIHGPLTVDVVIVA